jgi:hypothetical protein
MHRKEDDHPLDSSEKLHQHSVAPNFNLEPRGLKMLATKGNGRPCHEQVYVKKSETFPPCVEI